MYVLVYDMIIYRSTCRTAEYMHLSTHLTILYFVHTTRSASTYTDIHTYIHTLSTVPIYYMYEKKIDEAKNRPFSLFDNIILIIKIQYTA